MTKRSSESGSSRQPPYLVGWGGATPRPCPARHLSGTAQCERNSNGSAGANFSETSPESSGFPASESLVGLAPGFRFSFSRSTQKAEGLYADSK